MKRTPSSIFRLPFQSKNDLSKTLESTKNAETEKKIHQIQLEKNKKKTTTSLPPLLPQAQLTPSSAPSASRSDWTPEIPPRAPGPRKLRVPFRWCLDEKERQKPTQQQPGKGKNPVEKEVFLGVKKHPKALGDMKNWKNSAKSTQFFGGQMLGHLQRNHEAWIV